MSSSAVTAPTAIRSKVRRRSDMKHRTAMMASVPRLMSISVLASKNRSYIAFVVFRSGGRAAAEEGIPACGREHCPGGRAEVRQVEVVEVSALRGRPDRKAGADPLVRRRIQQARRRALLQQQVPQRRRVLAAALCLQDERGLAGALRPYAVRLRVESEAAAHAVMLRGPVDRAFPAAL